MLIIGENKLITAGKKGGLEKKGSNKFKYVLR